MFHRLACGLRRCGPVVAPLGLGLARVACCERRVVIDTDPGVDDALAILLALASPELRVEGFSIALGNGKELRALGANARLLLRLADVQVPVSLGCEADGPRTGAVVAGKGMKEQLVHGHDNLGNV